MFTWVLQPIQLNPVYTVSIKDEALVEISPKQINERDSVWNWGEHLITLTYLIAGLGNQLEVVVRCFSAEIQAKLHDIWFAVTSIFQRS